MHLPEFTLVSGTLGSFCSLKCLLVETERKVKEVIPDFACIDIFFNNLCDRLTDVP